MKKSASMKKDDGISLITLLVTIIVMIIIATITIMSGINSVTESSNVKLEMEIKSLKEAVAASIEDITAYLPYIDNMTNGEITYFISQMDEEKLDYYRVVDSSAASVIGVDGIEKDHFFIVDYGAGNVFGNINMEAYAADNP